MKKNIIIMNEWDKMNKMNEINKMNEQNECMNKWINK